MTVGRRSTPRPWLRPVVDAAMTAVYLLQMMPGKVGNPLHEVAGVGFVLLFVAHHLLNRGWLGRLGKGRTLRARVMLASDVALLACAAGTAATGVLMSRSAVPWLSVPAVAHAVRPLHGTCAYAGLMLVALHAGLHLRAMRGYAGLRGGAQAPTAWTWAVLAATLGLGMWAFLRLGVVAKLTGAPSFPDAMTPLPVLLAAHLALAAPFVAVGARLDDALRGRGHEGSGVPARDL